MRIGEILVEQRKLRASDLSRALAEKPADKRLCSFLIAKGLVDFDDASRALGEQKGVACALSKHLAGRDPALARLIPAELGRASCALPIGRSSKGSMIVCVRDPAPALVAALRQTIREEILMVIAPASRLEHLVADAYGSASAEELDVDFDIAVEATPVPRRVLTTPPVPFPRVEQQHAHVRLDTPPPMPPPPDMDALDPESIRLSLTDLDDVRVDKDPGQSGQLARTTTLPPPNGPLPPLPSTGLAAATEPPRRTGELKRRSLDEVKADLSRTTSREAATDVVLAYVATRWTTGLVLAVRERAAIGYRGHRVIAPESVTVSLGSPSTLQRAVQTRTVSVEMPSGVGQSALMHALGGPAAPAVTPVLVAGQPIAVMAVGDPLEGAHARDQATADLVQLAEALGTAYARIAAR